MGNVHVCREGVANFCWGSGKDVMIRGVILLFIKALQSSEGSHFTSSAAVCTTSLVNQGSLNIRLGKDLWLVA